MRVLSVASEAFPLIKTGGLADVVGALPAALAAHDVSLSTLLPAYPPVKAKAGIAKAVHAWTDVFGGPASLLSARIDGHPLLLLDAPHLFDRDGGPYVDSTGTDWPDNWQRFAALAQAAAQIASGKAGLEVFDVLHAHDWQAALAPAYLRYADHPVPRSLITIHNMAFQGHFDAEIFPALGLPKAAWSMDGVEYFGGVGFLKAGLACADAITTVSPSYAAEIHDAQFGMGLDGIIRARHDRVHGILNGIDPVIWSSAQDGLLPAPFTARTLGLRRRNKRALEKRFALERDDGPLFIIVSRLTWQKGMDVLAEIIDAIVHQGARLAILGTGEAAIEQALAEAAQRHTGRVSLIRTYDEPLSHLMQGGGDAILVPSRFEPCGLTQLYGLAYGCVPVVARTGGLADTIVDANEAALRRGVASGIQFESVRADLLYRAVARACALYRQPPVWKQMQKNGMATDFSWAASGAAYARLYHQLLEAQ